MKTSFRVAFVFLLVLSRPGSTADSFVIGGDNSDDAIRHLTRLTGLTIAQIEDRARPCEYTKWSGCSSAGFLGKSEGLISRLLTDNQLVHSRKLTHAKLASFLFTVMKGTAPACPRTKPEQTWYGGVCTINGTRYEVSLAFTAGWQDSIFDDKLIGSYIVSVTNPATKQTLEFADLLPAYIQRYGFYEGDTPYRVAPQTIIKFFDIR